MPARFNPEGTCKKCGTVGCYCTPLRVIGGTKTTGGRVQASEWPSGLCPACSGYYPIPEGASLTIGRTQGTT
jgi:hypothetical protein